MTISDDSEPLVIIIALCSSAATVLLTLKVFYRINPLLTKANSSAKGNTSKWTETNFALSEKLPAWLLTIAGL